MRMPSGSTSPIVTMLHRLQRIRVRRARCLPAAGRRTWRWRSPSLEVLAGFLIALLIGLGLAIVQAIPEARDFPAAASGPEQATATSTAERTPPPLPTCVPVNCSLPAATLYDSSDSVFSGRVIEIEQLGPEEAWSLRIRLAVEEIWKGPRGRELTLRIDRSIWACHWRGELGEIGLRAMVFAHIEPDGGLGIRRCYGPAVEEDPRAVFGPGEPASARQPAGGLGGAIYDIAVGPGAAPTRMPGEAGAIAEEVWLAQGHRLLPESGLQNASGVTLDWPEPVSALAREGDRALLAAGRVLYMIDLAAEGGPEILYRHSLGPGWPMQILQLALDGDRAVVLERESDDGGVTWRHLIAVIDLASGRTLSHDLIGEPDAQVIDMLWMGDRLVVSSRMDGQADGRIHVFGLSRPGGASSEPPTELARVEHPAAGLLADAHGRGGQAFLTYHERQLARLALADPGPPSVEQVWTVQGGRFERAEALAVDAEGQIHLQVHAWRSRELVGHLLRLEAGDPGEMRVQSPVVHASPRRFDASLAISRTHLLLGDASGLARIGSIEDPEQVSHMRSPVDVDAVAAGPGWMVAGSRQAGLLVYDRGDALAPTFRASLPGNAPSNHLLAGGDYALWQSDRVRLIDLRDPGAPALRNLGPSDVAEPPIWGLSDDRLAVLHPDTARLSLYDLRDLDAPRMVDSMSVDPETDWQALAFDGDQLHLAYHPGPPVDGPIGPPGLPSLELASFEVVLEAGEPRLRRGQDRTLIDTLVRDASLVSMALSGDRLWLLHRGIEGRRSEAMLAGFELSGSGSSKPRMHARLAIPGAAGPIVLDDQRLYISSQGTVRGIHVVDLSSPESPQMLSPLARGRGRVSLRDDYAYVANGPAGLWIYPPESSLPPSPTPLPVTRTRTPTPTDPAPTGEATTPAPTESPIYLPVLRHGRD